MCICLQETSCYFNPRSHKGRDQNNSRQHHKFNISIHAPTRGATTTFIYFIICVTISIHAPTRGATHVLSRKVGESDISIHAPTRGATAIICLINNTQIISIHAPTRGATGSGSGTGTGPLDFNPRSHKGSDRHYCQRIRQSGYFNPRSHKGSDNDFFCYFIQQFHFNPRSHKGSDASGSYVTVLVTISIHAPTRGATGSYASPRVPFRISIHAPTRGATGFVSTIKNGMEFQSTLPQGERLCGGKSLVPNAHFNPRSHKGSDWVRHRNRTTWKRFQSTLPQGERRFVRGQEYETVCISIHAPTRGAT